MCVASPLPRLRFASFASMTSPSYSVMMLPRGNGWVANKPRPAFGSSAVLTSTPAPAAVAARLIRDLEKRREEKRREEKRREEKRREEKREKNGHMENVFI